MVLHETMHAGTENESGFLMFSESHLRKHVFSGLSVLVCWLMLAVEHTCALIQGKAMFIGTALVDCYIL